MGYISSGIPMHTGYVERGVIDKNVMPVYPECKALYSFNNSNATQGMENDSLKTLMSSRKKNKVCDAPLVTIFCQTYNQESYISDALEGFVSQKCDFPFEVLVHDDASTDSTPSIIKQYENNYPNIIYGIYQTENQFSKGVNITEKHLYPIARGSYFALCEGDDFWIDPLKLQKQVDAIRKHVGVVLCGTASMNVNADTKKVLSEMHFSDRNRVVEYKDILGFVQQYATASFLFSRSAYESYLSSGFNMAPAHGDFKLSQFFHAIGRSYYIDEPTVSYREFAKGSINAGIIANRNWREIVRFNNNNRIESLRMLDSLTCNTLHEYIVKNQSLLTYKTDLELKDLQVLRERWSDLFCKEPLKTKMKVYAAYLLPSIYDFSRRLKVR